MPSWNIINGVLNFITGLRAPTGTISAPAFSYSAETNSGWYRKAAGSIALSVLGVDRITTDGVTTDIRPPDGGAYFRVSNGIVVLNSMGLALQQGGSGPTFLISTVAAPTVTSAGTSPSIVGNNGTAVIRVNVGTGGTATTIVLGLPGAGAGWTASAENITSNAANRPDCRMVVMASTSTSLTLQYQTVSTGAAKAFTASDIVHIMAFAY